MTVKAEVAGPVVDSGTGVPGRPHGDGTVRGGTERYAPLVVEHFHVAVAVMELQQVRLGVELLDIGREVPLPRAVRQ